MNKISNSSISTRDLLVLTATSMLTLSAIGSVLIALGF